MNEEQKDFPKPETELPKPQTDLPEIEKEIESKIEDSVAQSNQQSNAEVQTVVKNDLPRGRPNLLKYFIIGFLLVLTIGFIATETYLMGKNQTSKQSVSTNVAAPSPTPDPTADWQTFNSSAYPFSIKYPNTLETSEIKNPFYIATFKRAGSPTGEFATYDILAAPNTFKALNPSGYDFIDSDSINKLLSLTSGGSITIGTGTFKYFGNTTVDGLKAMIVDVPEAGIQTLQRRVIFQKDGNNYVIVNYNGAPIAQDDFNEFLSTFKFTNPTTSSSVDTSNWKSYTSVSEPTLSFKYPSTWTLDKTVISPSPNDSSNGPREFERATLTSKNGSQISFDVGGNNIGGACSDTATNTINSVTPLQNAKGLSIVDITNSTHSGADEFAGISSASPKVGKVADCSSPELIFYSKVDPQRQIILSYDAGKLNPSDKEEAMQILESLKY